jgi:hypothetical protein
MDQGSGVGELGAGFRGSRLEGPQNLRSFEEKQRPLIVRQETGARMGNRAFVARLRNSGDAFAMYTHYGYSKGD